MYTPRAFRISDDDALAIIDAHPFAVLATTTTAGTFFTHVPLLRDGDRLIGHLAGANEHAMHFGGRSTALFSGPHAYISPRWYVSDFNVPTWNYQAVHVTGLCRLVRDPARGREIIDRLVERYERGEWRVDWSDGRFAAMLGQVHAFELEIEHIAGKSKMSQNKSENDVAAVAARLRESGAAEDVAVSTLMADAMAARDRC
jgi:transcriptional regulator